MARPKTWVLVTDGVHATVLRDIEPGAAASPLMLQSKAGSTHLRDIGSDRPGRSFASDHGGRRSAMEPGSDPVAHGMRVFARDTLRTLETHHRAGRLTRLAIFAAPRMLGILREEMPGPLAGAVVLERDANLVGLPLADLRRRVTEALGKGSPA